MRGITPEFVDMSKEILYPQIQGVTLDVTRVSCAWAHRTVWCATSAPIVRQRSSQRLVQTASRWADGTPDSEQSMSSACRTVRCDR
jgi:hypothetical protein